MLYVENLRHSDGLYPLSINPCQYVVFFAISIVFKYFLVNKTTIWYIKPHIGVNLSDSASH